MFWRFGFHNPSAIDSLLDKDDVALEELLDEDDLLQECKAHNQKLIDLCDFANSRGTPNISSGNSCGTVHNHRLRGGIPSGLAMQPHSIICFILNSSASFRTSHLSLREPTILAQLLNYITSDELDDRQRFKYPYVACEVLSCEVWSIVEAVIENLNLLTNFWQFLDRPAPLNPLQANYFHKVIAMFSTKKTNEVRLLIFYI
ncbi:hypothetical protein BC938DRAFT_473927 [Jimgerdemannia flammicorona]|uniref:Uncharacterized protein n=1 Tax=Jimgerdemannia flammicorona TaxID=994334 RepID=A0A433QSX5_9FUNG|nr:hypothetical protein BC938DRAFT_473927 [Jimgerdemannia flammicorona]